MPVHTQTTTPSVGSLNKLVNISDLWPLLPEMSQQSLNTNTNGKCDELLLRLRKRQTNWNEINSQTTPTLEWMNPCGGQYVAKQLSNNGSRKRQREQHNLKKIWRKLLYVTRNEYKTLKFTTPVIDIEDIRIWKRHQEYHDMLPRLQLNATVSLRRWHRHLQVYVAAFAYLRRQRLHWSYNNVMTKELKILKLSARNVLCNIETAINSTTSYTSKRKQFKIFVFKSRTMERKLNLHNHPKHIAPQQTVHADGGSLLDLKFVKYYYFQYLRRMIKSLKFHLKKLQKTGT